MKKTYIKPDMTVVELKAKTQILAGSNGEVTGTSRSIGMGWDESADAEEEGLQFVKKLLIMVGTVACVKRRSCSYLKETLFIH